MNKVLGGLALIVAVVAAVLFFGPRFVDWNAYKPNIAAALEDYAGGRWVIAGDVTFSALPRPQLLAEGIDFPDKDGGGLSRSLISAHSMALQIAVPPLFRGEVEIEDLILSGAQIDLRRQGSLKAQLHDTFAENKDQERALRFRRLELRDSEVLFDQGEQDGQDVAGRLTALAAVLTAAAPGGPYLLDAQGDWSGQGVKIKAELGRRALGGGRLLSTTLVSADEALQANASGRVSEETGALVYSGQLELVSASASNLIPYVTPNLAPILSGLDQVSLKGDFDLKDGIFSLSGGEVRGGPHKFDLEGQYDWRAGRSLALSAEANRLTVIENPLRWLKPGLFEGQLSQSSSPAGVAMALDLNLRVGTLLQGELPIRDLSFQLRQEASAGSSARFAARLPGGTDVVLEGRLATDGDQPLWTGKFTGKSEALRNTLAWQGWNLDGISARRLRSANWQTDLLISSQQVTLSNLQMTLDSSQISGGLAVALRDRPAFGLGLNIDAINLDAYLPKAKPQGSESNESNGASAINPLVLLESFDANLDIKAASVTWDGENYRDLDLVGTLRNGELEMERARVGDHAGLSLSYQGSLRDLAQGGSFDGRYDISANDSNRLWQLLAGPESLDWQPGPINASGSITGTPAVFSTDSLIFVPQGEIQAIGIVEPFQSSLDLQLNITHESFLNLAHSFGLSVEGGGPEGPLALGGRLRGKKDELRLVGLRGQVGETVVTGSFGWTRKEDRSLYELDLESGPLNIGSWFGLLAAVDGRPASQSGLTRRGVNVRWSRAPGRYDWMEAFDLSLKLRSEALNWGKTRFRQGQMELDLRQGLLNLHRFKALLHGGDLTMTGRLQGGESLSMALAFAVSDMQLSPFAESFGLRDLTVPGKVSLNGNLNSQGISQAEWVSKLSGRGELSGQGRLALDSEAGAVLPGLPGGLAGVSPQINQFERLIAAFSRRPASLSGSFEIKDGVIYSRNLLLQGDQARAKTRGEVDLPSWRLKTQSDLFEGGEAANSGAAALSLELDGPLDSPDFRISGGLLQP